MSGALFYHSAEAAQELCTKTAFFNLNTQQRNQDLAADAHSPRQTIKILFNKRRTALILIANKHKPGNMDTPLSFNNKVYLSIARQLSTVTQHITDKPWSFL